MGAGIEPPAPGERALILADVECPQAASLAAAGHLVISEAGGAAGAGVLAAGFHLLGNKRFMAAHRPDRVVVLGRPTLHRQVTGLLTDNRVRVEMVAPATGWRGVAGNVRRLAGRLAAGGPLPASEWTQSWRAADRDAAAAVAAVLDGQPLAASPVLARALVAALAEGTLMVLGSSQPVRDVSLASRPRSGIRTLANRGAAGIDGTVSTAIGCALSHAGPAVALLGDLTLLHDLSGLIVGPDEPRPDLTIVVSNNDGGGIFSTLEPGDPVFAGSFERVFGTPHRADLGSLVRGAGHRHLVAESAAELAAGLGHAGITVVEVRTDRVELRGLYAELRAAVDRALA